MNVLVGERLSIITSKMQTTRHRIKGIVNGDDFQIVYSDTPGILKPNYKLQETMMKFVNTALIDADVILYVTDVIESPGKNEEYVERIKSSEAAVIVLINKIDLSTQEKVLELYNYWSEKLPLASVYAISATEKFNTGPIFDRILELLPEGPAYFPKDELTDRNERFFVSEIIREKILLNYDKEVPYSVEVEVEQFKEEENILNLNVRHPCEPRQPERNYYRAPGESPEKSGNRSPPRHGRIFPEESFPAVIRESKQRLARKRPLTEWIRVRYGVTAPPKPSPKARA